MDEVGTEPSSDADSDLFGLGWGDDPIATINSVTERNDRTRGGKELLAFVDSGAVDNVLPKSACTEYPLEATWKSQSGVGFKGAHGSHIKHYGQRRPDKRWKQHEHHLGSRGCAQAADLCQSSAWERSQACIRRDAEDPVQEWRLKSIFLDDSDVSRAIEQCREVCRRKETFLVDVIDWD